MIVRFRKCLLLLAIPILLFLFGINVKAIGLDVTDFKVVGKNETINVSKEAIEEIANEVVKKLENNTDKLLNEFLKGSQKEEPVGLYNQKEDSKLNIFESFFNGIFKNEREEK